MVVGTPSGKLEPMFHTLYHYPRVFSRHANARLAIVKTPTLRNKRVGPHCIRHSTAMALLRSGVDINTIRIWLGHGSLQTTHLYAESDLKMKANALARCEAPLLPAAKRRSNEKGVMSFLTSL